MNAEPGTFVGARLSHGSPADAAPAQIEVQAQKPAVPAAALADIEIGVDQRAAAADLEVRLDQSAAATNAAHLGVQVGQTPAAADVEVDIPQTLTSPDIGADIDQAAPAPPRLRSRPSRPLLREGLWWPWPPANAGAAEAAMTVIVAATTSFLKRRILRSLMKAPLFGSRGVAAS